MRGLYAIVDVDVLARANLPVMPFARAVVDGRPAVLQLRAKTWPARDTLAALRALAAPCRAAGVLLFANDRPDLAVLAGCDGVHVGQTDVAVEDVRRFAPRLRVGLSTHDAAELAAALAARPDYVAFGPVFPTTSKAGAEPVVGLDGLAAAAARAREAGVPLVAIGGIDATRAEDVAPLCEMAAAISALLVPGAPLGVSARVASLHAALSAGLTPSAGGRSSPRA